MNPFYPKLTRQQAGQMFTFGLVGALIAGAYGMLHDQVTYRLGPEYFTKLKFLQFHYLDFQQPVRWVVAEIGFLATWWVGLFAGWFMGRVTLPHMPWKRAAGLCLRGVALMMLLALAAAATAWFIAPRDLADARMDAWDFQVVEYEVDDAVAFVQVAYIHNASYLGGLAGLIAALFWLKRQRAPHGEKPVVESGPGA